MAGVYEALKSPVYASVPDNIKEIFVKCILGFKGQNAPLKNLLQDLGNYMQKQGTEDAFISHELILETRKNRGVQEHAPVIFID